MTTRVSRAEGHAVRKAVANCDYRTDDGWEAVNCEIEQEIGQPGRVRLTFYTSRRADSLEKENRAMADVGVSSPAELDALIAALSKARDLAVSEGVLELADGR